MGNWLVEGLSAMTSTTQEVTSDILVLEFTVVTACMVGKPHSSHWTLVDTGLENSADFIRNTAAHRFGKDCRPQAIILTHGHFDHVGSVITLADEWDVPVYIHALEIPYVTGKKDYPTADPSVSSGLVAKMSPSFPHTAIDLGCRAVALPMDGSVPGMPGWRWIPTPGHTEGHISLFRDQDCVLLAGDAFSTLKQESLWSVLTQQEEISGPPAYLTTDWEAAKQSIERLQALETELAIPSHGQPMRGEELSRHLKYLVNHFEEIAVPEEGRFVQHPAQER